MKRILLLAALFSLGCAACGPIEYDTFATITGTVVDSDTHRPIDGVTVNLSPSGRSQITGSDGYFQFADLDAMQYTVTVQKTGYSVNRHIVNAVAGETENITITMKKN